MGALPILHREFTLGSWDTPESVVSPGSVERLVLELEDKDAVETVIIGAFGPRVGRALALDAKLNKWTGRSLAKHLRLLQKKIRYETCISTQVGCALDCQFCASSLVPFVRNLGFEELLAQIETVERCLPDGGRLKKVVFAGVGEPLMNYDNVAKTVRRLAARGVPSRINTVGVVPYLKRLFEERLPVELIVSVHAPDDALRAKLMPAGKGYALDEICGILADAPPEYFIEAKYLLLRGLNDSLEQADALVERLRGLPIVTTLQMYNRIEERDFEASPIEQVHAFSQRLRDGGLNVQMLNTNIGEPVRGGCGQLRAHVKQANPRLPILGR